MGTDVPAEPMFFLKPPSSIIRDGEAIVLHPISTHIEFEGEIALVIGRRLTKVTEEEAIAGIAGVVALTPVTVILRSPRCAVTVGVRVAG
jgi:2-keto-4-pentenoate hydratase/2-oxohepta-3-ene-1,7-dioic acid hydratase in catechol pathway